jgi:hypothetical protein
VCHPQRILPQQGNPTPAKQRPNPPMANPQDGCGSLKNNE